MKRYSTSARHQSSESGSTLIASAIIIPTVLMLAFIVFDLARLFLNVVYAQELALFSAKILSSTDPDGYAFPDAQVVELIRSVPGENSLITEKRENYWTNRLDDSQSSYWGLSYYPDHDKKVYNLAHQYALDLNPRVYFPIPEPLDTSDPVADLGNKVNCTIEFSFASGSEPPDPLPSDMTNPANVSILREERDRIVEVTCAVPLFGLKIMGLSDQDFKYVRKRAYAYRAGNIRTTTG